MGLDFLVILVVGLIVFSFAGRFAKRRVGEALERRGE
jgi:hypothetical protein